MREENLIVDLSAPARLADLPDIAAKFFAWWKSELRALLPWGASQAPQRQSLDVSLYLRRNHWFLKSQSDAVDPLSLDTNASDAELSDQIMHSQGELPLSRLTVLLPRDQVLLRRLELPQMAEARLRQAVELQIDRLSPFKSDAVRFAAKLAGRDVVQGTMQVDVAIAPLARVEPVERRLKSLGYTPMAIDVEGDNGIALGFDLRAPLSQEVVRARRNTNLALATGAALVWGLAIFAWNDAGEREIGEWQARIADLRPAAERSAGVRRQMEAMMLPVSMANVHDAALPLAILNELTNVLPETTRVVDLKIEGVDVRLSGLATNAPELIGMLEASAKFKDVKFLSPVVRKPDSTIERFEIALHLEGAGL
ncbi:MAG: PilN domain-containing protein [Alphaproteobacteria bacterium]|nr:PilN domain-containing protein [Alphaproteobacteria bacterium]